MKLSQAIAKTLRSKRFWIWQITGATIYAIPVAIRFATGSVYLPILSLLEVPWIDHFVPGNLVEKILVSAFFPGGAGAVAGEILATNRSDKAIVGKSKYLARFGGAMVQTAAWSAFQLWGNLQNIRGSYGGNIFEYPMVFPLNFLLASFSIFTPDVLGFVKSKLMSGRKRLSSKP
jgi:hypothetical protein